ncbi:hypothetical protein C2S51_006887 [Perilla frutescens var. frutescens]|nr:hypothetical protein C2S51_006887 [Perilla frutescens var. frutescens]
MKELDHVMNKHQRRTSAAERGFRISLPQIHCQLDDIRQWNWLEIREKDKVEKDDSLLFLKVEEKACRALKNGLRD